MDRLHDNMNSLADRVSLMSVASEIHQIELLDVINVFIDQLRTQELFASLHPGLVNKYPFLKTNAVKKHAEIEDTVLRALKYRMMSVRDTEISDAYAYTFQWIYN